MATIDPLSVRIRAVLPEDDYLGFNRALPPEPTFYRCPTCDDIVTDEPKDVVVKEWNTAAASYLNKVERMCAFCYSRVSK
jgi:hypothetical protein